MLDAKVFAKYTGFTEEEVQALCRTYNSDFEKVKRWYDGYLLEEYQVYNPKAVVEVMTWNKYQSYWSETGTYESIVPMINMNFDGLKTAMIELQAGGSVKVDTSTFQNDMINFFPVFALICDNASGSDDVPSDNSFSYVSRSSSITFLLIKVIT